MLQSQTGMHRLEIWALCKLAMTGLSLGSAGSSHEGEGHALGTAFQVSRKEMGGKTEATSSPITKNSQLILMPILMRMIDQTPARRAKMSTDSRDTSSICRQHHCYDPLY